MHKTLNYKCQICGCTDYVAELETAENVPEGWFFAEYYDAEDPGAEICGSCLPRVVYAGLKVKPKRCESCHGEGFKSCQCEVEA